MRMTLSISQKTWQLNLSSAIYWSNVAKWILWASSKGSLAFISPGVLHPLWWQYISTNWDLHPTWLKASSMTHGILLQWLCLINQVSLLMQLPLPRRRTTLRLWNDAQNPIKAWSAALVGSLAPLVLILRRSILSCLCISKNPPQDIY